MMMKNGNARRGIWLSLLLWGALGLSRTAWSQPFVHPGCLCTTADFNRMAAMVQAGAHPWIDSWNILTNNWHAQTNYSPHAVPILQRGNGGGACFPNDNYSSAEDDAAAIYQLALRWKITGDNNYANTATNLLNQWSSICTNLCGDPNIQLLEIYGGEFACGAEILRSYTNWQAADVAQFQAWMTNLWYPMDHTFLIDHMGTCSTYIWANWDLCSMASMEAIGILCDNTNIYQEAITYFKSGVGNGNIEETVYHLNAGNLGQGQEEGRDQGHSGLEVSLLGTFCQMAWNQGTDLFGYENNRVLSLCEYFAKYNLGNPVPYVTFDDCNNDDQTVVSDNSRGDLRPAWDLICNHYVNLKGVAAPWSAQYAALVRPEGGGGNYGYGGGMDQLGFTTLTASQNPIAPGTPPSGLTAALSGGQVVLSWWGAPSATNYNVKRATISGGPYTTVGNVTTNLLTFTDANAVSGTTYYYTVSARSATGESANSGEAQAALQPVELVQLRFDEGGGTNPADATGNGWNGTLMGGATWTSGHSNSAVNLNGTTNYVNLPVNLTAGLNDFTIAAWVYLNAETTWMRIFDFGVANNAPIPTPTRYMFLSPEGGSGVVRFAITSGGSGAEEQINGTAALPTGGWHHVAVTLNGTLGVLYVDGVVAGTNNAIYFTPAGLGTTTQNCLGRSQFSGDPYLNGKVDDFRIYSGALSAAQIAALVAGYGAAPAAPTNVTATAVSASRINLTWSPVANATNYDVLTATTNGGPYTILAAGVAATNFSSTALVGGATYYYEVSALNNGGKGANSTPVSATTLTPPGTPTGLAATGVFPGQINLSWTAGAGATSYNVLGSWVSGGPYVNVAAGVAATGCTNTGLTGNLTCYYVVAAVNANGVSSNSAEVSATPPVPPLTWQGAAGTNWDINGTTNWLAGGAPAFYQDGEAPLFNDGTASNLVNLAANVSPFSVTFSNTIQSYTVSSAGGWGIGGSASLGKWGANTVTLDTANTFTGGLTINAGTLALGGAGRLGGGNYAGGIVNYGTLVFGSTAAQVLSGVISGPGGLVKSGTNSLALTGVNTCSGATTVNAGSLWLTGNGAIVPDSTSASTVSIGAASGSSAAFYQSGPGSAVKVTGTSEGALQVGATPGGYGYYNLSAGSLTLAGEMDIGGSSGGAGTFGQFDLSGGSVTLPDTSGAYFLANRGAAGECSVVNLSGGTVGISSGGLPADGGSSGLAVNWSGSGAAQTNVTTISSNAVFNTPSFGAYLNVGGNPANVVTLNLINGGTLVVEQIAPAAGASTVNFNGGTLIEGGAGGVLFGGNAVQTATIYSGGATINDNGYAVSVGQNLSAPAGNGLAAIPVATAGAGYVMPPQIIITGGGGSGATAFATVSGGGVAGIAITSPGTGYTSAPTVTLVGGGYTTAATHGPVTLAANPGGGLTKTGSGTVALSGVNTYTGPTVISSGTLQLNGPVLHLSFDKVVGGTNVLNDGSGGAAMNGVLTGTNISIVSGGRYGHALSIGPTLNAGYVLITNPVVPLNTAGSWTVALWLKTTNAGAVYLYQGGGGWSEDNTVFHLNDGSPDTAGTHAGGVSSWRGWEEGTAVINDGNWHFVVMTCTNGTKVSYVDGAVDAWLENDWGVPALTTGSQIWIGACGEPNDGVAALNGLIDEVYIFNRALSLTEVSNLMTQAGVTSQALPTASAVTVAVGAVLDLNGYNSGLTGLNGGGTVDTTSTNFAPVLTLSNNASTLFSGIIQDTGDWLSLVKTGGGTLSLTGTNLYGGTTTVSNGELVVSTVFAGRGNVVIKDGATLGVTNLGGASSAVLSNLTLGVTGATTLEFLNVSNRTKPLIQMAGGLTLNGISTIKITGTNNLAPGNTYPLINDAGGFSGNFSSLQLLLSPGLSGVLVSNANVIALSILAAPSTPTGLTATAGDAQVALSWNASANAANYQVRRSTSSGSGYATLATPATTNDTDTAVTNGTTYYYVVAAVNGGGGSTNSAQVSARPVSQVSTNLSCVVSNGRLQLAWPPDHTGWRLQSQTNALTTGLGANWVTVSGSVATNQVLLPPGSANGSVFFRLVYP